MPDNSTDAPRRSRRKEARPGELLEAALALFLKKGYSATHVEAVVDHSISGYYVNS